MAVQIPDPGTGNGQTGDNEYVFRKKVKDNFSDQNNAASRLIGAADGQIPTASLVFKAAYAKNADAVIPASSGYDCNNLAQGSRSLVSATGNLNTPPNTNNSFYYIETINSATQTTVIQIAYGYTNPAIFIRTAFNGVWQKWISSAASLTTYTETTASGANVVVTSNGELKRSTSSERYKDILAPLELDDNRYADAMALKPIIYRSTADADNPAYHYYSFSAEELGAYDPAFTLWRETETVTDADGNVTEQPLAERQAEGININALLAMSHAIAIKQGELIKGLQEQINALKPKLEV